MSEPFLGEIRMFGGSYAPDGWAFCWGQPMSIAAEPTLYSILGTRYGGDGKTTFWLPDLRGRVPYGQGVRPISPTVSSKTIVVGETGGRDQIQLNQLNMPTHTHEAAFKGEQVGPASVRINVTETEGTLRTPRGNMLARSPDTGQSQALVYAPPIEPVNGQLAGVVFIGPSIAGTVRVDYAGGTTTGYTVPFDSTPPFLGINFIIALRGFFPPRS